MKSRVLTTGKYMDYLPSIEVFVNAASCVTARAVSAVRTLYV